MMWKCWESDPLSPLQLVTAPFYNALSQCILPKSPLISTCSPFHPCESNEFYVMLVTADGGWLGYSEGLLFLSARGGNTHCDGRPSVANWRVFSQLTNPFAAFGHHSSLWPKATTFEKSQRCYSWPSAAIVCCGLAATTIERSQISALD